MTSARDPRDALGVFAIPGALPECRRIAGGHINETWRAGSWILQRLNPEVFPQGRLVMENVLTVTRRLAHRHAPTLELVPTRDGGWWHTARDGAIWRLYAFIGGGTLETAPTPAHAEHTAQAFGTFSRSLSDPPLHLHLTLPAFHDTRRRLAALEAAALRDRCGRAGASRPEIATLLGEHALAAMIPGLLEAGELPVRPAHNDAKIANVIFDHGSAKPLAIIDLDTTMPGSPLHDFGDLIRSMVSAMSEDGRGDGTLQVRDEYFRAIVRGFLTGIGGVLSSRERGLLVTAARATALEQAARFLTDHLDGDRYYAVAAPDQNLARARMQLALFRGLSADADRLESLVARAG